jgi:hypothetical protein
MGDVKARHSTEVHRDFVSQTPEYYRKRSLSISLQPDRVDIGTSLSVGLDASTALSHEFVNVPLPP